MARRSHQQKYQHQQQQRWLQKQQQRRQPQQCWQEQLWQQQQQQLSGTEANVDLQNTFFAMEVRRSAEEDIGTVTRQIALYNMIHELQVNLRRSTW